MFPKDTKFLIVDDFPTMRKIVRKVLVELGYTNIDEAEDGKVALPLVRSASQSGTPYGLIISDWSMPAMSGIELLKACKTDKDLREIPFLLITAENEQKHILDATNAGVSGYVVKPFTAATLKAKMERVYQSHTITLAKAS